MKLKVGDVVELGGRRVKMDPRIGVYFMSDGPAEHPATSEEEAIQIVRRRYPDAHFESWEDAAARVRPNTISRRFYASAADVIHDELSLRITDNGFGAFDETRVVGWITWVFENADR